MSHYVRQISLAFTLMRGLGKWAGKEVWGCGQVIAIVYLKKNWICAEKSDFVLW